MSISAMVITLLLAGQASPGNSRYPAVSPAPGTGTAAATGQTGGGPTDGGLIPKIGEPPPNAQSSGTAPAAKSGAVAGPYDRQPPAPATTGQPSAPINGVSPPPAANGAQSPYRGQAGQFGGAQSAAAPATTGVKPSAMMKQMMSPPPGSQLTGGAVSLMDVVAGARSRQEQAQRVEAYWDLCSSVADYNLGVREQDELAKLRQVMPRAGATMQLAEQKFAVRLSTSKQAAVASQRRLASLMGRGGASLPLPYDLPHCGNYDTQYDKIFAGRPSAEAKDLAALLPLRYAELKDAASGITSAQEWIGTVARGDNGDGTETARALELLALRRRAFVQIARDYNRRIARYAELSTPGEIGADRLVSMLIKTDIPPTATRPVLPNGTTNRQGSNSAISPRTFAADAEGWESASASGLQSKTRDESVRPAGGQSVQGARAEKSLLVPSR